MSNTPRCDECKYWVADKVKNFEWTGECYRYPTRVARFEHDWCGEFQPNAPLVSSV